MRTFFSIFVLCLLLAGCRASKESKAHSERTSTSEVGLEFRSVDRLWSSIAESGTMKIEFYPYIDSPEVRHDLQSESPFRTAQGGDSLRLSRPSRSRDSVFAFGAVKSIELTLQRDETTTSVSATDSVFHDQTTDTEVLDCQKASEARHGNGTVIVMAIVAALAGLVWLLFKEMMK